MGNGLPIKIPQPFNFRFERRSLIGIYFLYWHDFNDKQ